MTEDEVSNGATIAIVVMLSLFVCSLIALGIVKVWQAIL